MKTHFYSPECSSGPLVIAVAGCLMTPHPQPVLTQQDGVTVVTLDPRIKAINEVVLADIGQALLKAAEAAPPLVVVDLAGIDFFSSSFIELMFRIWNRLKNRQGRFAICNLHPYCREVLEITNLHTLWTLSESRTDAIAALKTAQIEA